MRLYFAKLVVLYLCRLIPDSVFISLQYYHLLHKPLNLRNPKTYWEKLQWLKLHDRNPNYTSLVDKVKVKQYVAQTIGDKYVIPTLFVWDSVQDIELFALPNQFVMKWNHNSGSVIICKDKLDFHLERDCQQMRHKNLLNGYNVGREWPYKNVSPKIFAEKYIGDPIEYKFYCFDGCPKLVLVVADRFSQLRYKFYDADFNPLPIISKGYNNIDDIFVKPTNFDEMLKIASKLSKGILHVRVDLLEVNERIYFNELTFYDKSGYDSFIPQEYDYIIGQWLILPSTINR